MEVKIVLMENLLQGVAMLKARYNEIYYPDRQQNEPRSKGTSRGAKLIVNHILLGCMNLNTQRLNVLL